MKVVTTVLPQQEVDAQIIHNRSIPMVCIALHATCRVACGPFEIFLHTTVLQGGELLVVDPTLHEEAACEGQFTVVLNTHAEVLALSKGRGVGITPAQVMRCVRIAAVKVSRKALLSP